MLIYVHVFMIVGSLSHQSGCVASACIGKAEPCCMDQHRCAVRSCLMILFAGYGPCGNNKEKHISLSLSLGTYLNDVHIYVQIYNNMYIYAYFYANVYFVFAYMYIFSARASSSEPSRFSSRKKNCTDNERGCVCM